MKKLLFIGLILAICILAFPQVVLAAEEKEDSVIVDATVAGSELSFSAARTDAELWPWDLEEEVTVDAALTGNLFEDALTFTVDSRANWEVTAEDTNAAAKGVNNGHMVDGAYVLFNPFLIATDNEGTPGMTNIEGTPTIEEGIPADIGFKKDIDQRVIQADYASDGYTISITFTCTNTWVAPP